MQRRAHAGSSLSDVTSGGVLQHPSRIRRTMVDPAQRRIATRTTAGRASIPTRPITTARAAAAMAPTTPAESKWLVTIATAWIATATASRASERSRAQPARRRRQHRGLPDRGRASLRTPQLRSVGPCRTTRTTTRRSTLPRPLLHATYRTSGQNEAPVHRSRGRARGGDGNVVSAPAPAIAARSICAD
jgi:hypothetical protein